MRHETAKGVAIAILFLLTMLVGLLPLKIRGSQRTRQRILGCCNCFAGGVFFATCLLDLLPMVREKYEQAFRLADVHTVFPVAEFTTCAGFFIVLIVEQIVHTLFHDSSIFHGQSNESERQPLMPKRRPSNEGYSQVDSASNSCLVECHQGQHASFRVYILILALSLHSVFEGLALGLIEDVTRLLQIAVAIVIHKSIIAFSLSVNLVQHEMQTKTVIKSAFLFSIMGPIGIGIGIAVLHSTSELTSSLTSGILQGIANGTFLFVTFFEIFQRELEANGDRLLKVIFMLTGYTIVTVLVYYSNDLEHDSGDLNPSIKNSTLSAT